jgi:hypothetical protein
MSLQGRDSDFIAGLAADFEWCKGSFESMDSRGYFPGDVNQALGKASKMDRCTHILFLGLGDVTGPNVDLNYLEMLM